MITPKKNSLRLTVSQKSSIFSQDFVSTKKPSPESAMHAPSLRRLLATVFVILLPAVLIAQVTIRERVTIDPKSPEASKRDAISRTLAYDYFAPPLFIQDYSGSPALPLSASLSITGEVNILGAIGGNQQAVVVLVLSPYLEHRLAWKGREPISWGGKMYEGTAPYTGTFSKGSAPNVQLYVFDGKWGTGARELTNTGGALSFAFTSYLSQGTLPRVDVTGSAAVTGEVLPEARLNRWEVDAYPTTLECSGGSSISFVPVDGYGQLYEPYGIPRSDAQVTLSVEAKGEYAYLASGTQEGKEITVSLAGEDPVYLMLDVQREAIPGERDTAIVTISGGGKTAQVRVALVCEKLHHFRITADPEEVDHGLQTKLTVIAEDVDNLEVVPEQDFDVRLSLSSPDIIIGSVRDTSARLPRAPAGLLKKGADRLVKLQDGVPVYGSFSVDGGAPQPDEVTVSYSLAREGRVSYVADGQIPYGDYPEQVTVNVGRADGGWQSGSVDITVNPTICAQVIFDPPVVSPGDTALLSFKKILDNGTPEDFPADQLFNIAILSGGDRGVLVSGSGEAGTTLVKVPAPVWYVAPASIEGDTLVVGVVATAAFTSSGGGASVAPKAEGAAPLAKVVVSVGGKESHGQADKKKLEIEKVRGLLLQRAGEACPLSEVVVAGTAIDHLEVTVEPDTIRYKEIATVKVRAKDKNDEDVNPPADERVHITLRTDEKYGNLEYNGDESKTVTGVPYSEAIGGRVKFTADGQNPIGLKPQPVLVGATQTSDARIAGTGSVAVKCLLVPDRYPQGGTGAQRPSWADDIYDESDKKISGLGCALACIAMVLTANGDVIDPGSLNSWMKKAAPDAGGFQGESVNFDGISSHSNQAILARRQGSRIWKDATTRIPNDESAIKNKTILDQYLEKCTLVIVQVYNEVTSNQHWVVVVGKEGNRYRIIDPGPRNEQFLDAYYKGYFWTYVTVWKNLEQKGR